MSSTAEDDPFDPDQQHANEPAPGAFDGDEMVLLIDDPQLTLQTLHGQLAHYVNEVLLLRTENREIKAEIERLTNKVSSGHSRIPVEFSVEAWVDEVVGSRD